MKRAFTICLMLCFSTTLLFSQQVIKTQEDKRIDSLIKEFKSAYYDLPHGVKYAKLELENYQKIIIPKLIAMLYNTTKTPIIANEPGVFFANADVSYYKGTGGTIPYNLDWLSIRAGWLLEELTFNDFGFSSNASNESKVPSRTYAYNSTIVWEKIATAASIKKERKIMADKVAAWWQKNKTTWTRLGALKEALQSNNEERYTKAIFYMNTFYNRTSCDGLTDEVFDTEIKPLLRALKPENFYLEILIEKFLKDGIAEIVYFKKDK
jgi:hypothetical protein